VILLTNFNIIPVCRREFGYLGTTTSKLLMVLYS
jgi:hypothetical protein